MFKLNLNNKFFVIPAKAGINNHFGLRLTILDSRFRGNDTE